MYRCPRCNNELAENARFCTKCGFNRTNARMSSVPLQQGQAGQAPTTTNSAQPRQQAGTPIVAVKPPIQTQKPPMTPQGFPPQHPGVGNRPGPGPQPFQSPQNQSLPSSRPSPNTPAQPLQGRGQQAPAPFIPATPMPGQPPQNRQVGQPVQNGTPLNRQMAPPAPPMSNRAGQAWQGQRPPNTPFPGAVQPPPNAGLAPQRGSTPRQAPNMPLTSRESVEATNRAAEQWRRSWFDRQRAEAGPAMGITRGQAVVSEPLMIMQQSLVRMRAIVLSKQDPQKQSMGMRFWVSIMVLVALIGSMGAYIIYSYLPGNAPQNSVASGGNSPMPILTIQGKTNTLIAGQSLRIHGEHFGANDVITFNLDTTLLPAKGESSDKGSFDAVLLIAPTTLAGSYQLEAMDNTAGKQAFLTVQILPTTMPTNTTDLQIQTQQYKTLTALTFAAQFDKSSTLTQNIIIHNKNNDMPLQWTAATVTTDGGNWLSIADGRTTGQLDRNGSIAIAIGVSTTGLKIATYKGDVVFTINGRDQILLPVTLQLASTAVELVIDPNPLIGVIQGGGTCLPETSLTLINLGNMGIQWSVKGDGAFDQQHLHFDGQTGTGGTLLPGETKVVKIACIGIQLGEALYHLTVYYNGQAEHIPVSIRTTN